MPDVTSTTTTTNVLKCPLKLEDGSKLTITVPDPKSDLTKDMICEGTNATGFIGYILDENMINKDGVEAVGEETPYYYTTEKIIFD